MVIPIKSICDFYFSFGGHELSFESSIKEKCWGWIKRIKVYSAAIVVVVFYFYFCLDFKQF